MWNQNQKGVVFFYGPLLSISKEVAEYVPKSLSYSCMHMALTDINPPPRADGYPPPPLLAREIVLGRLYLESKEDKSDW